MATFYTRDGKLLTRNGNYLIVPLSFNAIGGTISYAGGYTYHTFLSDDSFYWTGTTSIDLLVVGGGGGGGYCNKFSYAGGGGAGGVLVYTGYTIDNTLNYHMNITIGAGGLSSVLLDQAGTNGDNTTIFVGATFGTVYFGAGGGGGGGSAYNNVPTENWCVAANNGLTSLGTVQDIDGNGGGGAGDGFTTACGYGTGTFDGGISAYDAGGGGGGSSSDGGRGDAGVGGNGGTGEYIWGNWGVGGGGGSYGASSDGAGTDYGGGNVDISGTANTGGGAGASRNISDLAGGSGLVVIRYLT